MADYVCKVGDTAGRVFQQLETAQTEEEARQKLSDKGYFVFSVSTHLGILSQLSRKRTGRAIRSDDFLVFNQQFNTLVRAGLPILKALDLLADRAAVRRLRPILQDVRQRVRNGALLSEALAEQGSFPPVYVTVITAGERSGNLSGVLEQYIAYLRVTTGFRSRLVTALIYPSILVATAIGVVSYIITFAMPAFTKLYADLNIPLPTITSFLLAIAVPLRTYFLIFLVAAVIVGAAIFLWTRSYKGAIAIDRLKPRFPYLGDVWLKAQIAQFVRTLSTLLSGGTPLVSALLTSSSALGTRLISSSVHGAAERVREGQSLHVSLAETHLIPELALEMIEVGEASGALAPMLQSVAEFYEEEVNTRLQRTLTWLPIVVLMVMAVVVGFILLALYLPLFSVQIQSGG
jgi:type IV pilus assembly protein PilC